jgi:uncharacterized protein (DUF2249 family)/hemerythrin-like domain-containing protein
MAPESRRTAVLEAFDRMRPGDSLLVDSPRPPLEELHALQHERRGQFDWAPVDHPPCWRIELTRRTTRRETPRVHETLAWEHARLDDLQRATLTAIAAGDLPEARRHYAVFERRLNRHIHFEEELLFPVFERKTGSRDGVTTAMRGEHREIRLMLERAARSLYGVPEGAEHACQTLRAVLERHDFGEEAAFYDVMDSMLEPAESEALVEQIQEFA